MFCSTGGIRTHTGQVLNLLSLPIGLLCHLLYPVTDSNCETQLLRLIRLPVTSTGRVFVFPNRHMVHNVYANHQTLRGADGIRTRIPLDCRSSTQPVELLPHIVMLVGFEPTWTYFSARPYLDGLRLPVSPQHQIEFSTLSQRLYENFKQSFLWSMWDSNPRVFCVQGRCFNQLN